MRHSSPYGGNYRLRENGLWLSDNTQLDVSSSRHGFVPKTPADSTKVLAGDGTWKTIVGASGVLTGMYGIGVEVPPATVDPANDEFDGSAIDTAGTRFSGATAWTATNIGTSTVTQENSMQVIQGQIAGGTDQLRGYEQVLPGGNWKYRAAVTGHFIGVEQGLHLFVRRTANSKAESFGMTLGSNSTTELRYYAWTTTASFSATVTNGGAVDTADWRGRRAYVELEYNGTSILARYSPVPAASTFRLYTTRAVATFLGGAPDRIGIAHELSGSPTFGLVAWDWFRRIA